MPISDLLANNRRWAARKSENDPDFFQRLARQQAPEYLWIGCSDSRVPANDIVDLDPGELFVHRNVANLVVASDLNLLAVLQFAVEILRVRHVIIGGHYGCGGVRAALERVPLGLVDNWLHPIKRTYLEHREELEALSDMGERVDRLCELNVRAQVNNVAATTIVQDAWRRGQALSLHGLIYGLRDGLLRDLDCRISGPDQVDEALRLEPAPARG
jgi:carbonic anhydrase